ncbi:acyltransferase family protein [Massilia cavernae]|uniref:Acyltransferase n=1 Tax=Massilia cavernae TaxID=2320864 RepID=A0A418Y7E7_9BURK|nr:acyltransferase [Massilia cavernae]RJG25804.1 acyltransferase [Massilia cavernae]
MDAQPGRKLEAIHVLRGLAALFVVLYHFQYLLAEDWPLVTQLLGHGEIGVDIFFYISGFVIYSSTESLRSRSARSFLIRRFFRVIIPAWVAMAILATIKPPYLYDLLLSVLFIPLQNGFPPEYGHNFLIVAWTLTFELVFYGAFATSLYILGGRYRGAISAAIIVAMVIVIQALTGAYTLNADLAGLLPGHAWFPVQIFSLLGNPIILEFLVGMALAWCYRRGYFGRLSQLHWTCSLVGVATVAGTCAFQYSPGNGLTNSGMLALLIVIVALAIQTVIDRHGMWGRGIVHFILLGEISYSLYLIHPLVRAAFKAVEPASGIPGFLILLAFTLVASLAFHRLIEIPAQRIGRTISEKKPVATTSTPSPTRVPN